MTFSTDRRGGSPPLAAPVVSPGGGPPPPPPGAAHHAHAAAATSAIVARREYDIVTLPNGADWNRFHQRTRSSSLRAVASSRPRYKRVTRDHARTLPGTCPQIMPLTPGLFHNLRDRDLQDVARPGCLQRRDQ